ncbi:uncharacterized protein [Drosophila pseudoobscura]|uniref:Peptidase C45 hydrolase domain-containing protein n=1 Tax=Drosophila pseudoobscura pseudoobscura TaxID=46245 RepID=A0A6I8WD94_DROPS|nr:uncharacterized protein LOC26533227 [Drosophila pseudoobscura]
MFFREKEKIADDDELLTPSQHKVHGTRYTPHATRYTPHGAVRRLGCSVAGVQVLDGGLRLGLWLWLTRLFLLHLDDILPQALKLQPRNNNQPTGCSTIIVNQKNSRLLGHTEDALTETLNHYYFVDAHIISDKPQGKYNVKEEHFMSLCYAGHLPGYTMNQNYHGLVFTINTSSAELLRSGKTPRHFLTRALLATSNVDDAFRVLRDAGVGAADACSINFISAA